VAGPPLSVWLVGAGGAGVDGGVIVQLRRKRYVALFTNVELLASVAPKRPGWRRHLTFALFVAALAVLTFGTAEPTGAVRVPRDRATVMVAIDVAKFAGNASVVVPPTIDRDALKAAIDNNLQLQDSTAIGEAVFTCLDAISVFAKNTTSQGDKPPPARIVVMSNGANDKGRRPDQAAAATSRVSVSTIAFGTDTVDVPGYGPQPVPADRPTLHDLAVANGGAFHVAASAEPLQSVYRNIGQQIGSPPPAKSSAGASSPPAYCSPSPPPPPPCSGPAGSRAAAPAWTSGVHQGAPDRGGGAIGRSTSWPTGQSGRPRPHVLTRATRADARARRCS
jgi:Ca-activated chloride channel homolog